MLTELDWFKQASRYRNDIDIHPHNLLEEFDYVATTITNQIYPNEAEIDICHRITKVLLQQ